MLLTDVCIPNCWRGVEEEYVNDEIYYNIGNQLPVTDLEDEFFSGDDYVIVPPRHYSENFATHYIPRYMLRIIR